MTKGRVEFMKLLRIVDEKGEYINASREYVSVESLTKEDLLRIVKAVYDKDENDYDPYVEATIKNKAQDIIYKNVSSKLDEIKINRDHIKAEIEHQFKDAFEKYK